MTLAFAQKKALRNNRPVLAPAAEIFAWNGLVAQVFEDGSVLGPDVNVIRSVEQFFRDREGDALRVEIYTISPVADRILAAARKYCRLW